MIFLPESGALGHGFLWKIHLKLIDLDHVFDNLLNNFYRMFNNDCDNDRS